MGVCASSSSERSRRRGRSSNEGNVDSIIKVIHMDGLIEEFSDPIKASKITSRNPNFLLCNSEEMLIGSRVPCLSADENLQIGQIYFLIPHSLAQSPLSLPDLCNFAIKASSATALHSPFFT